MRKVVVNSTPLIVLCDLVILDDNAAEWVLC